jgi:hypothetical protein
MHSPWDNIATKLSSKAISGLSQFFVKAYVSLQFVFLKYRCATSGDSEIKFCFCGNFSRKNIELQDLLEDNAVFDTTFLKTPFF